MKNKIDRKVFSENSRILHIVYTPVTWKSSPSANIDRVN